MRLLVSQGRLTAFLLFLIYFVLPAHRAMAAVPYSGLVADVETDRVLYERNADELRHPASVTKMMTLYLVFEALENGELYEDTMFRASSYAVMRPPSRLGLKAGDAISVHDAILALVTRSANDAASVIAEGMAGSEAAFAAMMTEKARELGMTRTLFRNASGLPDPNQVTTARDMYRLGKALYKHFPEYYTYFSTPKFYYNGQGFENHNHLMERYPGMDGIKTGFINASGFNLVASAQRGGRRLIGVVFGGPSAIRRDNHMREILDDGFAQLLEGAPPGIVTAEFDRPDPPPSLLARPRLAESADTGLVRAASPRSALRPVSHQAARAAPARAKPAPEPRRVRVDKPDPPKHAAASAKPAPAAKSAASAKAAPAPKSKAPKENPRTAKKTESAPSKAVAAKGAACPPSKGKSPKCGSRG